MRRCNRTAILVGYLILAIWSTWPLARSPTTLLPTGSLQVGTVPLFNLWSIWWNSDRLWHGFQGYWNAPIFHPVADTFAFSEPQPATILVAPVIWLTGSRVLAYNIYLWLSLVLNGVFAERLLRTLRVPRLLAAAGGAAMLLLPIVHWQIDVVQLTPIWGILWAWTACLQFGQQPTLSRGAELGLAIGVTFLICGHQALFLTVLLIGATWPLLRHWRHRQTWVAGLCAIVVCGVLVAPIVLRLQHALARDEFARDHALVAQLSAVPGDYTAHTGQALVNVAGWGARPHWGLSAGWLKLACAVCGLTFGLTRRRWRRWTVFLLLIGLLAFLLSLGPNLHVGTWQPWWTLSQYFPGFSRVRNVFRFAFFVQIAVVLLAIQGLHALRLWNRWYLRGSLWRFMNQCLMIALTLTVVFEIRPSPLSFTTSPNEQLHSRWVQFVRDHTQPESAIICLPVAAGNHVNDYELTTQWMYYGTYHRVPLVNGYSGFFPREYFDLQDAINQQFLNASILKKLHAAGVEFVVVNTNLIPRQKLQVLSWGEFQLESAFVDPVGIEIYRLRVRAGKR